MIEPLHFFIAGTPKGQPRPKAFSRGGHAGVYDPGSANEWKQCVRDAAKKAAALCQFTGPLSVHMTFKLARPKGHYGSGRNSGQLKADAPDWHTSKPDADNLAKAVMDALNDSGFWKDDSEVSILTVEKAYSNNGETGCFFWIKKAPYLGARAYQHQTVCSQ